MRLRIQIDNVSHDIDSTDPVTLGRWMVEIFGRVKNPSPATHYQIQAMPSWVPDEDGKGHADWIQDTRYWEIGKARSPRELLRELNAWLSNYESRGNDRDYGRLG